MSEKEGDNQPDAEQDTTNIEPPPENPEQEQEYEQEEVQIEVEDEEYVVAEEAAGEEDEGGPVLKLEEDLELTGEEEEEGEIELTEEELEALFNKNTESFRCLAQILLSRSSLLKHPLFHFPPLLDPGIDEAFNYVEPEEPVDDICAEKYKKICKDMNIVPLSRVIKSLPTKELNLRYYGLTNKEFKAIARALKLNTFVEVLNLEENFLNPDSTYYIEELLRENNTLQKLNMKECRIGPEGAANLGDGIMLTQSLKELDLSYNDLGTQGIKSLMDAFKDNGTITHLNLGHNNLDLDAAPIIAYILKENCVLEDLDLAWNNLGTPQAMKIIFDSLSANPMLRSLGMAWNGISLKSAVKSLTKFLKKTERLEVLDLSNNRIGGGTCNMIKNALKKNKCLRALSLAFNILTPENAHALVEFMISKHAPPDFELLDMENVFVKKDFVPLWKKATRAGKRINITGILGNWTIKGPNVVKLLFDRAILLAKKPKRKKLRKDFGHFILSLPDDSMKKTEFETAIKKFKMKNVDADLMNEIVKHFPRKKDVDCGTMKGQYLELYPDTQPPPPKKRKKGKKGKKKKKKQDMKGAGSVQEIQTAETVQPLEAAPPAEKRVSIMLSKEAIRAPSRASARLASAGKLSSKRSRSKGEDIVPEEQEEALSTPAETEVIEEAISSEVAEEKRDSPTEEDINFPITTSQLSLDIDRCPSGTSQPRLSMHSDVFTVDLDEDAAGEAQPLSTIKEAPEMESEENN